jgi:hypothetical protein
LDPSFYVILFAQKVILEGLESATRQLVHSPAQGEVLTMRILLRLEIIAQE